LARDVDVLVHGAQFTIAQRELAADFGRATVEYAVALAEESGARRLVLFHLGPSRTDDEIDEIVRSVAGAQVPVAAASEGMVLTL
jgi:ribonuclease BN (tRNA processing enzyme)